MDTAALKKEDLKPSVDTKEKKEEEKKEEKQLTTTNNGVVNEKIEIKEKEKEKTPSIQEDNTPLSPAFVAGTLFERYQKGSYGSLGRNELINVLTDFNVVQKEERNDNTKMSAKDFSNVLEQVRPPAVANTTSQVKELVANNLETKPPAVPFAINPPQQTITPQSNIVASPVVANANANNMSIGTNLNNNINRPYVVNNNVPPISLPLNNNPSIYNNNVMSSRNPTNYLYNNGNNYNNNKNNSLMPSIVNDEDLRPSFLYSELRTVENKILESEKALENLYLSENANKRKDKVIEIQALRFYLDTLIKHANSINDYLSCLERHMPQGIERPRRKHNNESSYDPVKDAIYDAVYENTFSMLRENEYNNNKTNNNNNDKNNY